MIYSSDTKKPINDNNVFNLIREVELTSQYNYHTLLAELCMSELNNGNIPLNESFSIKGIISSIWNKITEVFAKIKEVVHTVITAKDSLFQFSDQLYKSTSADFLKKIEKYENRIRYKVSIVNADFAFGDNGSDINDKIIASAKSYLNKVKDNLKSNNNEDQDTSVEQDLADVAAKAIGVSSINIKDIKKTILSNIFLPEREYVGIDEYLYNNISTAMKLSPVIIKNAWDRACEKQMKELKSQAAELEKTYKNDESPDIIKAVNRCKAYILGCTNIVSQIHMAYLEANIKGIRAYRKIYTTVLNTIKMPKEKSDNK